MPLSIRYIPTEILLSSHNMGGIVCNDSLYNRFRSNVKSHHDTIEHSTGENIVLQFYLKNLHSRIFKILPCNTMLQEKLQSV